MAFCWQASDVRSFLRAPARSLFKRWFIALLMMTGAATTQAQSAHDKGERERSTRDLAEMQRMAAELGLKLESIRETYSGLTRTIGDLDRERQKLAVELSEFVEAHRQMAVDPDSTWLPEKAAIWRPETAQTRSRLFEMLQRRESLAAVMTAAHPDLQRLDRSIVSSRSQLSLQRQQWLKELERAIDLLRPRVEALNQQVADQQARRMALEPLLERLRDFDRYERALLPAPIVEPVHKEPEPPPKAETKKSAPTDAVDIGSYLILAGLVLLVLVVIAVMANVIWSLRRKEVAIESERPLTSPDNARTLLDIPPRATEMSTILVEPVKSVRPERVVLPRLGSIPRRNDGPPIRILRPTDLGSVL